MQKLLIVFTGAMLVVSLCGKNDETGLVLKVQPVKKNNFRIQIENPLRSRVSLYLNRNNRQTMSCIRVRFEDQNGILLSENQVDHSGFWNPVFLDSRLNIGPSIDESLWLLPGSTINISLNLEPYIKGLKLTDLGNGVTAKIQLSYLVDGKEKKQVLQAIETTALVDDAKHKK